MPDKPEEIGKQLDEYISQFKKEQYSSLESIIRQNLDQFIRNLAKPSLSSALEEAATRKSRSIEKEKEILDRIETLSKKLTEVKQEKKKKEETINKLQATLEEYQKQEKIKYLLGKVNRKVENEIRTNPEFLGNFVHGQSHNAFVLSIDIRNSTELMLNAKSPRDFALFLTDICEGLKNIIIENGGVFDKFTGDGVIAFFPEFYSGKDGGYRALNTATQAIVFYNNHYKINRNCFGVVIASTGLAIGIDYGQIHFVNIGESLSIVGNPVVYACRLTATDAGTICVNQPAKEVLAEKYADYTTFRDITLDIKLSGPVCAYCFELKGERFKPSELPWEHK